ncbi:restriction endonuclease subunit S [Bacillus pacificus]|nr:restriction endonuclease subunit S [Bacillus pacificus]MCC0769942.1 restriction endonuclease subunit S [Bacillus pacificus]
MKSYSNLKESGLDWLKDIPAHWKLLKLKYVFNNLDYKRIPLSSEERGSMKHKIYDYYGASGVIDKVENYIFDEPLILIGEDGANLYSRSTPLAFVAEGKYWVTNHAHILKPKNGNLYYWANLLESIDYTTYITGSAQPKLTQDALANIVLPVPSLEEQRTIWKYLSEKLKDIDSLIEGKKALITLLEEKRQTMITEAVTKGLNPNVKTKDSGVEWIGEIPEHWVSMRLKNAILLNPNKSEVDLNSNRKVTFVPMENIIEPGKIDVSLEKELSDVYSGYTYFKDEDIVMAKVTPCFENGNIAIANNLVNEVGFGTTELHVLRAREKQCNKFYYYLVQSEPFKQEGISMMYGVGGLKRIPTDFVSNYKFAAPPLDEQIEIANYLDSKCIQISNLKELINIEVEKLKAYRQSLIYEAVTGKIDVRDFEVEA